MIETDTVDCVIALGKNLFYNSSMESALLIRRTNKDEHKKGKVLFINAFNEVKAEKTIAYLLDTHIDKIFKAYQKYEDIEGFARLVEMDEILANDASLLVTNYVKSSRIIDGDVLPLSQSLKNWEESSKILRESMNQLFKTLS